MGLHVIRHMYNSKIQHQQRTAWKSQYDKTNINIELFVKYVTPAPTEPCGTLQNMEPETEIIQPIHLSRLSQNHIIFRKNKEIDDLNKRQ